MDHPDPVWEGQGAEGHSQDLEAELNSLNNLKKDMVGEIRGERAQLERRRTLKRERDLHVCCHLDDRLPKRAVQGLEGCGRRERSQRPRGVPGARTGSESCLPPLSKGTCRLGAKLWPHASAAHVHTLRLLVCAGGLRGPEMEHRSRAGQPLSASAQRILAALRAQHADRGALRRQRSVPSAGETGGAVLRRIQEEGSWSRTQQGSTTGDQRGAGRSWSRGHLGDHLQVEGIRDRPSLPPYAHIPELSWNSRSGGRAPAVGVPLSPQGPPEDEGGIRGNGAGPERESGARQLLLQSDIINMGGAQASGHGEREGPCKVAGREEPVLGALNHPVCQAGPQGGRRQFGRLLLPPWNRVSKEGEQAGRGKEGAESEEGLAKALGDGQIRSFGRGSWPAREAAFRLPGDSVTQGGDWVGWGRGEMLRFGRSLQRDGVVEDAEERRCRNGALLGMQPAVQGGFQVTSPSGWEAAPTEIECFRNPAWSDTGAGDQLAIYREEDRLSPFRHTVLQEDHLDNREHTGSAAVCPSLTEGQMETSNQDRPNDTASQVNGTDHGDSSEAAGVGSGRLESGVDLALESSCPIKEIPANSECTPPAPSTTGPSCPDHSQPLPRRGNSQGTANRVVPLKRRRASPPPKSSGAKRPGRWEPPRPSQERRSRGVTQTPTPPAPSPAPEACRKGLNTHGVTSESHSPPRPQAPPELPKPLKEKRAGRGGRGQETHRREEGQEPSWAPTSDPAVRDASRFTREERAQALQEVARAPALVLTMVYQDGSTQLCPKQKSLPSACGVLVLLKRSLDVTGPEEAPGPGDSLVFLRLEQRPAWAQQDLDRDQDLFTREVVQRVVSAGQVVVCYKAKDLLRSLLQHFRGDLGWKQVAQCRILDPQIAAWLLDPADSASCFQDLVTKHCRRPAKHPLQPPASGKASNLGTSLSLLYQLMMELRSNLQAQGLWELFSSMELSMIPVLAAMESHRIHVDKEALKRTSEMLGAKLKQLEQEAHKAAGQQFLVSSSAQLRLVLFEKLRLQDRCENRKLPKTVLKQQQSTSEAVLLQLQDLHPLPRIILEYRQVHKIKSTFVDGILSCMKKTYVSSTWNQTSAVSGRLSAKQPNFQALPRQPVQISKKQYIPGKQAEVVTVHPRDMFIPQEGRTFLAADFCQVELRLLAHLTSDPELLRLFQDPDADVFSMLASQWKGVPEDRLNPEDREHAKRIVYSVVYGAGRERLSGILGVSAEQASRFVDSFLQRYREVQNFIQRTIQQCQKQGYVVSIMGRRRSLPNIHSADWAVRNQAERQAVNFVVQGSAADLCKMAMIRIFSLVSSSSSLTPRLLAQIHDELLFEVEDSQVEDFAALVQTTMESLQHIDSLGVHLKVPLKVVVSSGRSWGSMSELHLPRSSTPGSLSLCLDAHC
ncbi:hypothetical protein ANANG_G00140660 [Anguilla anguilla]|uniref:DNA-directed DNA polymerase n=1 Tax=Anguilla anguilla TaxID=7936 RepID=A0A9D3MAN5_ANGAN|nr:hypothetical protein ANANG_G00140660 [Anguilla anguilla]